MPNTPCAVSSTWTQKWMEPVASGLVFQTVHVIRVLMKVKQKTGHDQISPKQYNMQWRIIHMFCRHGWSLDRLKSNCLMCLVWNWLKWSNRCSHATAVLQQLFILHMDWWSTTGNNFCFSGDKYAAHLALNQTGPRQVIKNETSTPENACKQDNLLLQF